MMHDAGDWLEQSVDHVPMNSNEIDHSALVHWSLAVHCVMVDHMMMQLMQVSVHFVPYAVGHHVLLMAA